MLKTVFGNEARSYMHVLEWFKDSESSPRTLNTIQGQDSHQVL